MLYVPTASIACPHPPPPRFQVSASLLNTATPLTGLDQVVAEEAVQP